MEKKPESIFINRELSWLDFDSRVLALAKEKTVPLGERIKFAAIFGSNMDEFFMVRVGSLYDQTLLKNNKTDNVTHMTAAEQIAAITPRVAELQAKCDKYFQHLVSALAQEGYKKVDFAKLAKPQEHFWKTYFQRDLLCLCGRADRPLCRDDFQRQHGAEAVPVPRDPQRGHHGGRGHDGSRRRLPRCHERAAEKAP